MGVIYIHKNYKDNYKIYIGQSINPNINRRWANGKGYLNKIKDNSEQGWHYGQPRMAEAILNSDWNKDWDHDILENLENCTQEELDDREAYWISFFDSTNPLHGYNTMKKSKGQGRMLEDTKKKISEAKKGIKRSEDDRKKMSEAQIKRFSKEKISEDTKKKMSEAHKGKLLSESAKEKISKANKGKQISEDTKKKMSEAHKGKNRSKEFKQKISEANKGRLHSEEEIYKDMINQPKRKRVLQKSTGIIFESAKEANRKTGLHVKEMLRYRETHPSARKKEIDFEYYEGE